jgi:F0F1-type ATP synthase epsilon subunit
LQRVRTDEARIHADVAAAVAEFDRAHVEKTLDQLRSRLQSPEFRNALAAAEHGAARAAAVAKADDGND